jgi:hypothetical protein
MIYDDSTRSLDAAFDRIEGSILPSVTMMLDALLDAAAMARPGQDALRHAGEIGTLAAQLEMVTRQVEQLTPPHFTFAGQPVAGAA